MPKIVRKPKPVPAPHPDEFPGEDAAPKPLPSSPPKINRGRQLPTPYRGVFELRLDFDDGRPPVFQKIEGTIVGAFGVCKYQGKYSVTHIASRRRVTGDSIKSIAGGVALALALAHLPWHLYPVTDGMSKAELAKAFTPASLQLKADYLAVLNSRKEWV